MRRRTVLSITAAALLGTPGRVPAGAQPGARPLKDIVSEPNAGSPTQ